MVFVRNQFANVVEWDEFRDDMIFYKWNNREIKKGSRLIIRPGQDAVFLNNGKIEGIFQDEGDYDIESEIIPFLSTLKEEAALASARRRRPIPRRGTASDRSSASPGRPRLRDPCRVPTARASE